MDFYSLLVGFRGSVVACDLQVRDHTSKSPALLNLCSDVVLLGNALYPHVLKRSCALKMAAVLYIPRGVVMALRRNMTVQRPGGHYVKSGV